MFGSKGKGGKAYIDSGIRYFAIYVPAHGRVSNSELLEGCA